MIIIYSNKPHLGKRIVEQLGSNIKEVYPYQKIVVISQLYFRNLQFQYPKKIKWSDYPYIEEPIYKFNETNWENWKPHEVTEENTLVPTTITTKEIQEVKTIIYADDPYNTNCHNFDLFLKYFFKDKIIETPSLKLFTLDSISVLNAWNERTNFYEMFSHAIKQSEIKRYFNYNYNINSMSILGYVLKDLGIDTNIYYISKYSLQLLYELRSINYNKVSSDGYIKNKTEGELVHVMHKWIGTGKYKRQNFSDGRLGSEMSSVDIMQSLFKMGLAEIIIHLNRKEIQITQLGELFLSKLHKDCLDKDLPFRYELWQNEDLEVAKPKIKKYLKNFFGKQKRKLNTINNEGNNHG